MLVNGQETVVSVSMMEKCFISLRKDFLRIEFPPRAVILRERVCSFVGHQLFSRKWKEISKFFLSPAFEFVERRGGWQASIIGELWSLKQSPTDPP